MGTISEETQAAVDLADPPGAFVPEEGFLLRPAPETPTPEKRKGGRGNKGPNFVKNAKKKGRGVGESPNPKPQPEQIRSTPVEVVEPPKTLIRGTRWLLRNVVTMMEEGYGWDKPDDYEEWLAEAAPLGAACIQKHFPDWMDRWGDEILLLAMLMVWVTPNVGKKLRERAKQNHRNAGQKGERENNPVVPFAESA